MPIRALTAQPAPARSAWFATTGLAVAVFLAYLAGGRLGIGATDVDYVFSPADPPSLQSQLPALDVPFELAPTPSTLAARGALAVALGRRTALRDLAAVTAALTVATFAMSLIAANVGVLSSLLAALAFAFGATNWSHGTAWDGRALFPSLALASAFSVLHARSGRRLWWIAAIVTALGAISDIAIVGFSDLSIGAARTSDLLDALRRELTPLGAFLAVLGCWAVLRAKSSRWPALVAIIAVVAWWFVTPRLPNAPVAMPLAILGWAGVAVALDWLQAGTSTRGGRVLIVAAAIILITAPMATRYRFWTLERDLPAILAAQTAFDFEPAVAPANTAMLAESRVVDATVALAAHQSHRPLALVPQSPDRIREIVDRGGPLFAWPNAQKHLERLGFVFERGLIGNTPVSQVTGVVPCADLKPRELRDVSLLLSGGSFIVRGPEYASAPGSVTIRIADRHVARVTAIEPRSTPYEITDSLPDAAPVAPSEPAHITTMHLPSTTRTDPIIVTLAAAPLVATAAAEGDTPVRICGGVMRAPTLPQSARMAAVHLNDEAPFGLGWHPMEADADFFRWTGMERAGVRVSVPQPASIEVTVTAAPAAPLAQHPTLALTVNDCRLTTQPMTGNDDHTWIVQKECWRPGFNQLWISALPLVSPATLFGSHDTRQLGARISGIRLTRVASDQNAK